MAVTHCQDNLPKNEHLLRSAFLPRFLLETNINIEIAMITRFINVPNVKIRSHFRSCCEDLCNTFARNRCFSSPSLSYEILELEAEE
jgi:hypothetical protein